MNKRAPQISIIIPTLNEAARIATLLAYLQENSSRKNILEILVIDGGSTDDTFKLASDFGATPYTSVKGRAKQMNLGARMAKGNILYFLHADTVPPKDFDTFIVNAINIGHDAGCFRMKFDTPNWFLHFFSWFSRINHKMCRGGDQSLYITKELFADANGFDEAYVVYEDTEFIGRLYQKANFKVLSQPVVTSARRYKQNGTMKLQYHFGVIHMKRMLGAGPHELYEYYQRKIAL